jgi:hypothetical protein
MNSDRVKGEKTEKTQENKGKMTSVIHHVLKSVKILKSQHNKKISLLLYLLSPSINQSKKSQNDDKAMTTREQVD